MSQRQFPVSWSIFCVPSTVLQVSKLSYFNRMCGKIFIPWKPSEQMGTFFLIADDFCCVKKNHLLYRRYVIMLQTALELFCNSFRFPNFLGTQKQIWERAKLRVVWNIKSTNNSKICLFFLGKFWFSELEKSMHSFIFPFKKFPNISYFENHQISIIVKSIE